MERWKDGIFKLVFVVMFLNTFSILW